MVTLKFQSKRELQSPRRLGRDGPPEERRTKISHEAVVIHSVENIEGINCKSRFHAAFLLLTLNQNEIPRPAKIHISIARALQTVSRDSGRPSVRRTRMKCVESGRHRVGKP